MKNHIVRRDAFSLIELLVVISIVSVLISLLLPALKTARETAMSTKCQAGMKQFGFAWATYASDWREVIPGWSTGTGGWARNQAYPRYLGADTKVQAAKLVNCPSDPFLGDAWTQQYNYLCDQLISIDQIRSPSDGFWFNDTVGDPSTASGNNGTTSRTLFASLATMTPYFTVVAGVNKAPTPGIWWGHPPASGVVRGPTSTTYGTGNMLFMDLHAKPIRFEEIPPTNDGVNGTPMLRPPGYDKFWNCFLKRKTSTIGAWQ